MASPKFNLNYIDQVSYLEGMHRSGWPYVLVNLLSLHTDAGVLCDTYVDRTFLWGVSSNSNNHIPYTKSWVGFIHHTFDTNFSTYNNETLFQSKLFIQSLPACKGFFVFSEKSKEELQRMLIKMGYNIPVVALIHPTQFVETRFSIERFKKNPNKKIVQVGAWLRDNYAIYRLNNGKPRFILENGTAVSKAALIGPKMEHYYRPFDFFRKLRSEEWKKLEVVPPSLLSLKPYSSYSSDNVLQSTDSSEQISSVNGELPSDVYDQNTDGTTGEDSICRDLICRDSEFGLNKYVLGAIDLLSEFDASVITYPSMSNDEYDTLLSENIVFLKLVDAAAVNTLQECIVRNTPIIINPLPAIVEVLGTSYPLYYEHIDQVPSLVTLEKLTAAYEYLVNMDKDMLRISEFMKSITESEIYINL